MSLGWRMYAVYLKASSVCFLVDVWWLCSLTVCIAHLFLFSDVKFW